MSPDDQRPATTPVPAEFTDLHALAVEAAAAAYAPYSRYRVGAAGLVDDGRCVSGCNVENAGYGVTLCAECGMVSDLVRGGGGRLRRAVCVNGHGQVIMPCGRCRQLLAEHAAADFLLLTPTGPVPLGGFLPQAFGPSDLEENDRR
ncbi:cytidine deaminase [Brachybacterium sp. EF45031]|uniref:cytidine deaminase n=1 Tax=Brachybacterium sillae TaxID=2810536 RepID=UPI00217E6735|nr:cytidine deaminase [Brachybacterium sillae]MCS6711065.1 cytidine deaminase [Brachybacterium sillae]